MLNNDLKKFEIDFKQEYIESAIHFLDKQDFSYTFENIDQNHEVIKTFLSCDESEATICFSKYNNEFEVKYYVANLNNQEADYEDETEFDGKKRILSQYKKSLNLEQSQFNLFTSMKINKSDEDYQVFCTLFQVLKDGYLKNHDPNDNFVWLDIHKYFGDHYFFVNYLVENFLFETLPDIFLNHEKDFKILDDLSMCLDISNDLTLKIVFDDINDIKTLEREQCWLLIEFKNTWIYFGLVGEKLFNIINSWLNKNS